jgi:hypothetical protein
MRRLLLLVLAMPLLAGIDTARACSYSPGHGPPTEEQLFARASAVFVARIVRVEEAGTVRVLESGPPATAVEAAFRLKEVLKGMPPPDGKVRAPAITICALPLLAGVDYVFFLYGDNFVHTSFGAGARPLLDWPSRSLASRVLARLREVSKKESPPPSEDDAAWRGFLEAFRALNGMERK